MYNQIDCTELFSKYVDWVNENPGTDEGSHAVGVKMADIKIRETDPQQYPWGHGSYAEGRLGLGGGPTGPEFKGRLKFLFSDRISPEDCRFDRDQSDIRDVTFLESGKIRIELISWGGVSFDLEDVMCYKGDFITGIMKEANGISMISLLLRKDIIKPGQDGFRDWP